MYIRTMKNVSSDKVMQVFNFVNPRITPEKLKNITKEQEVFRIESVSPANSVLQLKKSKTASGWDIALRIQEGEGHMIKQNVFWLSFFQAFPNYDRIILAKTTIANVAFITASQFAITNRKNLSAIKDLAENTAKASLSVIEGIDDESANEINAQIALIQEAYKAASNGAAESLEKVVQQMLKNAEGWL